MLRFIPSPWTLELADFILPALTDESFGNAFLRVRAGEALLARIEDENSQVKGAVLFSVAGGNLLIEGVGGEASAIVLQSLWSWAVAVAKEAGLSGVLAHTGRLDMVKWLARRGASISAWCAIEVPHG